MLAADVWIPAFTPLSKLHSLLVGMCTPQLTNFCKLCDTYLMMAQQLAAKFLGQVILSVFSRQKESASFLNYGYPFFRDYPCEREPYNIEDNLWSPRPEVSNETVSCACGPGFQQCPDGKSVLNQILSDTSSGLSPVPSQFPVFKAQA